MTLVAGSTLFGLIGERLRLLTVVMFVFAKWRAIPMSDTTDRLRELVRGWEHAEQMNGCDLPAPVTGRQLAAMLDVIDAVERENRGCRHFRWVHHPTREGVSVAEDCGKCSACALARFREVAGE